MSRKAHQKSHQKSKKRAERQLWPNLDVMWARSVPRHVPSIPHINRLIKQDDRRRLFLIQALDDLRILPTVLCHQMLLYLHLSHKKFVDSCWCGGMCRASDEQMSIRQYIIHCDPFCLCNKDEEK